jgi:hypothetical protein
MKTLIEVLCLALLLPSLLRALQSFLAAAPATLRRLATHAIDFARRVITDDGRLSPTEVISTTLGSLLMTSGAAGLAVCSWLLLAPPLAGLFSVDLAPQSSAAGMVASGTLLSLLLPAAVSGMLLSDLTGWTKLTQFRWIQRGRRLAFAIAIGILFVALLLGLSLGIFRAVLGVSGTLIPTETATEISAWLGAITVAAVDPLVLMSFALAATACEHAVRCVVALAAAVAATTAWTSAFLIDAITGAIGPLVAILMTIVDSFRALWRRFGAWITRLVEDREVRPAPANMHADWHGIGAQPTSELAPRPQPTQTTHA